MNPQLREAGSPSDACGGFILASTTRSRRGVGPRDASPAAREDQCATMGPVAEETDVQGESGARSDPVRPRGYPAGETRPSIRRESSIRPPVSFSIPPSPLVLFFSSRASRALPARQLSIMAFFDVHQGWIWRACDLSGAVLSEDALGSLTPSLLPSLSRQASVVPLRWSGLYGLRHPSYSSGVPAKVRDQRSDA